MPVAAMVHRARQLLAGQRRLTTWPDPGASAPETAPIELPSEPIQARRFGKTRTALSAVVLEDYAELIADLLAIGGEARPTDIARRLGVSHATAINNIARLKREGLATARPYRGVFLTEAGEISPPGCAPATGWWWTCCWRSAFRPRPPSRMPRASSTMSRTRRWPPFPGF